ncbi:hypothetical protein EMCRGX_G005423 [Ephydatia muelleri]
MPKLDAGAKEQLIIHQFLAGLPGTVSKQLRAAGDTTKLQTTFDRAKLLMSLEDEQTVATVSTPVEKPRVSENRVMEQLVEQVAALSKQVEALSTRPGNQQPDSRPESTGKLQRDVCCGQQPPRKVLSPHKPIIIAALKSEASTIIGVIGDKELDIMLDSGASVSLIREEALTGMNMVVKDKPSQNVRVVTAAGEDLPILYHVTARVKLNMVDRVHDFQVVENLVAAAILGVDFLRQQGLLLDLRTTPVTVLPPPNAESRTQSYSMDDGHSNLEKIWARQAKKKDQACSVADITDPNTNIVNKCTIPAFDDHTVYVRKKTGEIRLYVDYRELNKRTHKDAYPLPLIDEVQDRLSGDTVFTKLDLHSGYWQVPVNQEDQEKTAFSPGPGMGLFQFKRMPFGLCGASSTFQRLMNTVMRGLLGSTTVWIMAKDYRQGRNGRRVDKIRGKERGEEDAIPVSTQSRSRDICKLEGS